MKKICLTILVSITTSSCATLMPYSYDVYSAPALITGSKTSQNAVEEDSIVSPLDSICHIKTTRKGIRTLWLKEKSYHGSAALIENRFLLTAAHNVFDYPASRLTSITVRCGEADASIGTVVARLNRENIDKNVFVPRYESRLFKNPKKYEFDYAFIDLSVSLQRSSSFELEAVDMSLNKEPIFIGGFPGGTISDGNQLYEGKASLSHQDQNLINYDINTATGNSGGPVWIKGDDGGFKIVAVHVKNSGGRLVNKTLLEDWAEWRSKR